ncbi:hypothetical protein, partial [Bacteroides intestinalis]|uniref:hypothetical protein n=1 Tax=Bacteroides intestinalis TaxID=329854 RepID=UPI001960D54D
FCPCRLPLSRCLQLAGQPAFRLLCRAPGIVGSVTRRCCGDRVFQGYAFFLCPWAEKRERFLVLNIIERCIIAGQQAAIPSIYRLCLIPVPTAALPTVGKATAMRTAPADSRYLKGKQGSLGHTAGGRTVMRCAAVLRGVAPYRSERFYSTFTPRSWRQGAGRGYRDPTFPL